MLTLEQGKASPRPTAVGGARTAAGQVYWVAPALLMLCLGLWRVDRPELWRDELFTWSAVTRPLPDMMRMLSGIDAVIGSYYLLLRSWTALAGTGEAALRLPSVLAMAAAAAVVARIAAELGGTRAGLIAGLVLCAMPAASRNAQEARPYAVATLAACLATLLLVRALKGPSTWRWIWYAVALTATGYAHLFAFTVLLGHAVAVGGLTRFRSRGWILAAAGACLAVAPLAAVGASQRRQVSYLPLVTSDALFAYPATVVGAAVVAGLFLALAVGGAASDRWTGWVAGTLAVVPTAALLAAGAVAHMFTTRYLAFTLTGWAVLAGVGLAGSARPARWVSLVLIGVLSLPAHQAIRRPDGHVDHGQRTAAASIAARQRPGDGIVYEDVSWLRAAMDYYLPTTVRPRDVLLARPASKTGNFVAAECADPGACLAGVPRLWVVHTKPDRPLRTMAPAKVTAIRAGYAPAGSTRYGSVTVTLYIA